MDQLEVDVADTKRVDEDVQQYSQVGFLNTQIANNNTVTRAVTHPVAFQCMPSYGDRGLANTTTELAITCLFRCHGARAQNMSILVNSF